MRKLMKSIFLLLVIMCVVGCGSKNGSTKEVISTSKTKKLTEVETGTHGGYNYELWKDSGTTNMLLTDGGTFSCSWSDINNALFRKGIKMDCSKTYSELGDIKLEYGADYAPKGNSYLCVYGWSRDPLVEFYIVESWGDWRPPGGVPKGTVKIDEAIYNIYETTRYQQPSIDGTQTFQQYWSVRTTKSTEGNISVSEHFKAWEELGMNLGKMYEVALTVEGYQSSGEATVYKNKIEITEGTSEVEDEDDEDKDDEDKDDENVFSGSKMECENMKISGPYAEIIDSPFSGVALYSNDDSCTYTQSFKEETNDFILCGASDNELTAKVDLLVGGINVGTFTFTGTEPTECVLSGITHDAGNQTVKLVASGDDGTWDAFVDYLVIK